MDEEGCQKSGDIIYGQPHNSFLSHQRFTFGSQLHTCTVNYIL